MEKPIIERLFPVPRDSGLRMDGYFVWGASIINVDGEFHMFASRWPEETGFPDGYRDHSEIVRVTSDNPVGPYAFREVVLHRRGGPFWDGKMCHNPKITKAADTFVLYYIGSAVDSPLRKIGYAWAPSVTGPWKRIEQPLPLGEDANNPAPYVHADGSVLLAYRDLQLRMHVARASTFDETYDILAEDVFPEGRLEDPDLFLMDGQYHMVMEDNEGLLTGAERHGGHLVSAEGVRWRKHDPVKVYTHTIIWDDSGETVAKRRERPELFNANAQVKGRGEPTHLITAVLIDGQTRCVVQPIAPARQG